MVQRSAIIAAASADLIVTLALCLIRINAQGQPVSWNRCAVHPLAFGSSTIDLVILVLIRNLKIAVDLSLSVTAFAWWAHISFCELVYAAAKFLAHAIALHRCQHDSTLLFDAACISFAAFAYLSHHASTSQTKTKEKGTALTDELSTALSELPAAGVATREPLLQACNQDEEAPLEGLKSSSSWREVAKLARPDCGLFCLAMICALCSALATSAISLWTGDALDVLIKVGSGRRFKRQLEELAAIAAIGAVCTGCRGGLFSIIGVRVNQRIRDRLFRHLLAFELGFFDTTATGDLSSRLSSDTAKIGDQVSLNVNVFARTGVQLATTLGFMIHTSPQLTLVACASVPIVAVGTKSYGAYVSELSKAMQDKLAVAMIVADEALSSILTVRSMAAEAAVANDFTAALDQYGVVGFAQGRAYAMWQSFNTALPNLVTLLLLYDGGRLVDKGHLSGGRLVAFMLLTQSLSSSFSTLADMYTSISEAFGAADKVFELMQRAPAPAAPKGLFDGPSPALRRRLGVGKGAAVVLHDVHFKYPARPDSTVLDGLSLKIAPGQVVALVGASGSGKSSVLRLIQHFYSPQAGRVELDGVAVSTYQHADLHRIVALVGQEPVLFARSVRTNVAYALEAGETDVEAALKLANAWEFVRQLPQGLDTEVGERGAMMSGGQKQRLAIARALARRPSLLLLDEATSALDAESERKVQASLDSVIDHNYMTVLVIAHRLSTIRHANLICFIRHGRLHEQGTHQHLMALPNGLYADLVRRQQSMAEPSPISSDAFETSTGTRDPHCAD